MEKKQTIPVVDLKDFISGSPSTRQGFIETLGQGLEELGFFALENHGVDHGLIDRAYSLSRRLFELDSNTKKKYEVDLQRGFTSFGTEHAKYSSVPDLKEFWHVGREHFQNQKLVREYPKNIWPTEIFEYKEVMLPLYEQLDFCALNLLKACALYLGEPEDLFSGMAVDGNTILRIIHYPPVSKDSHPASVRAAAHEDINLITLLCESTDEGLELLQKDGKWRPIHALNGQIVVDSGDMLQNLTNGVLKSTTHRVVNPGNDHSRRFSMPFFVHPRSEVSLNPLPRMIERSAGVKKFPDITAGAYLRQRLEEIGLTNQSVV